MDAEKQAELKDLVAKLATFPVADVLNEMPRGTGTVFQAAHDVGHRVGKASEASARETAERDRDAALAKTATLEARIKELEKGAPDVDKIHQQHNDQLEEEREKHQKAIARLTERLDRAEVGGAVASLEAKMLEKGLRPLHARVRAKDMRERITFDDDGRMIVKQKGRDAIPIDVKSGQDPLDVLADEAFNEAEADEKMVRVPPGPGVRDTTAGGSTPRVEQLKKIQEDVKTGRGEQDEHRRKKMEKLGIA